MRGPKRRIEIPAKFSGIWKPAPYKVFYGGRGSGKSWSVARALLAKAYTQRLRILCAREFQNSIKDSVHKLLKDQIEDLGLSPFFRVTKDEITTSAGSEFIFKGLRHNAGTIKSTEGIDITWVEEAERVSEDSWQYLGPTVLRKAGSEIWVTFNPDQERDPTYKRLITKPDPSWVVEHVNWEHNPWFPAGLEVERRRMLEVDPEAYEWVWGGRCRQVSDAIIFRNRVSIEAFETPDTVDRLFFGADWGFANDPTVLIRAFVKDECLYVDHEAFGHGVEIDEISGLFEEVPGSRTWPIKADSARPETISYMARQGFNIQAAQKWSGSVEDGVAYLKGFRRIFVHERCKHIAQEFRLYSYKVDPKNNDVLPVIVDKHNHGIDALRYALDGYIKAGNFDLATFMKAYG